MTSIQMGDPAAAAPENLTKDGFLGNRLMLLQPRDGYRAGVDPVFLAASVHARAGQRVLDLGCGVGTAALCLGARVRGLDLTGVEVQPDLAELARRNGVAAGQSLTVFADDLFQPGSDWAQRSFDIVLTNPPYFRRGDRTMSQDVSREMGLGEVRPLADWLEVAIRRVVPGGLIAVIQRAERLRDILAAFDERVGDVRIRPLAARAGRSAKLVIVTARKGAKGPLELCAPTVLHNGDRHEKDGDSYAPQVAAVLRGAAAWPWLEA